MGLEAKVHELARVTQKIPSLKVVVAQRESQILTVRVKVQALLAQAAKATHLVDLAFTHDGELCPVLICNICEKFIQTIHMRQLFYRWAVPMMQEIIRNLVAKVLRVHPEYTFDSQTMDLYLAPKHTLQHPWPMGSQSEDLSSPLLYRYPNTEGQIRCYGRDFMVRKLVAYPLYSDVPLNPFPLVLEPIVDPIFPLPTLTDRPAVSQVLVVQDSPVPLSAE